MKVAIIGVEPEATAGILLNLRMRWPDLEAICLGHIEGGGQQARGEVFDVILAGSGTACLPEQVRKVRAARDTVLIALSAQPSDEELVAALEAGADDYLPLSASAPQMVARISAALRRASPPEADTEWVRCGELRLSADTLEVFLGNEPIRLTPTEFRLLCQLVKSSGRLLTHEALESLIWGSEGSFYGGSLRKYVQRLRSKLQSEDGSGVRIVTVPRVGYRLEANS